MSWDLHWHDGFDVWGEDWHDVSQMPGLVDWRENMVVLDLRGGVTGLVSQELGLNSHRRLARILFQTGKSEAPAGEHLVVFSHWDTNASNDRVGAGVKVNPDADLGKPGYQGFIQISKNFETKIHPFSLTENPFKHPEREYMLDCRVHSYYVSGLVYRRTSDDDWVIVGGGTVIANTPPDDAQMAFGLGPGKGALVYVTEFVAGH